MKVGVSFFILLATQQPGDIMEDSVQETVSSSSVESAHVRPLRGFARLSPEQRSEMARRGAVAAKAAGTLHGWTAGSEEAKEAGRRGGKWNAAQPGRMASLAKKGGQKVSQDREHMAAIGRKGAAMRRASREAETGKGSE